MKTINRRRTNKVLILPIIAMFIFCCFLVLLNNQQESKASLAGWDPGNIMSDSVMSNKNTMTEAQIQSFLKSKNSCNDSDWNKYVNYTNKGIQYTWRDGHFVCMADENFGGESAAHIIWQAAQDYGINPQVLIVLLEKEQGLVTDTWPNWNYQYKSATGYGCPDTAACDSKYFGFKNQVRNAAHFFRAHLDNNRNWNWGYDVGWNNIKYHPDNWCGAGQVYIVNKATAALYIYTPYQPNQAALNWSGDACSAYGNRNFYHYFTEWFGNTREKEPFIPKSDAYIMDGIYIISSALNTNYVLDIAGDSIADKANLQLFNRKELVKSKNQLFEIKMTNDRFYTIKSVSSNKYLDVAGIGLYNKSNVQQFTWNDGCNQKWALVKNENHYSFLSACSGRALDIAGGQAYNNANIQIFDQKQSDKNNQKWNLEIVNQDRTIEDGEYFISNSTNPNMVLDVAGNGIVNKSNVQLFSKKDIGNDNQKFKIQRLSDGYYSIQNTYSGKYLDVAGASVSNNANVQIFGWNNGCNQKWTIVKYSQSHAIFSACSSRSLDIAGGNIISKTNVQLFNFKEESRNNQLWNFTRE